MHDRCTWEAASMLCYMPLALSKHCKPPVIVALQEQHTLLLKLQPLFASPMHPHDFCAAAAVACQRRADDPDAPDADWLLVSRDDSQDKTSSCDAQPVSTLSHQLEPIGWHQHMQPAMEGSARESTGANSRQATSSMQSQQSMGGTSAGEPEGQTGRKVERGARAARDDHTAQRGMHESSRLSPHGLPVVFALSH